MKILRWVMEMPKKLDLTGEKYGNLTVIGRCGGKSRYLTWECECACGNRIQADSRQLRSGAVMSCGCMRKPEEQARGGRKANDLTGRRYGKLTVLKRVENMKGQVMWKCRCDCGQITIASSHGLNTGSKKSCGCLRYSNSRKQDIAGKRFGKLVALYPLNTHGGGGSVLWKCQCDCGKPAEITVSDLNRGNNKSCGCMKIEYQKMVRDRLHLIDGTCIEWLDGRKMRSDNNSGFRGVFKKKNGRYSVTIGFKKKIYFIGCYEDYEDAVQARLIAEKKIHGAFLRANEIWQEKYLQDPEWGEKNPLVFEVSKENGVLIVRNSMESFMKPAQKMMKFADGTSFRKGTGTASKNLVVDKEMAMI